MMKSAGLAPILVAALVALCSVPLAYSMPRRCPTKRLARGKIQGGTDAQPGRYPYATSLQRHQHRGRPDPKDHFCGGVLIAEDLVVTAAHCVHPEIPGSETHPNLNIGGRDLVDDVDTETRETCRTIIHKAFDVDNLGKGFDIALLQLKTKSTKTPARLDSDPSNRPSGKAKALGWGKDATKPFFVELQEVELNIVENDMCKTQGFTGLIHSMMCAQGENADVCKGDSGGPLVMASDGCGENDILLGLTSFGFECTDTINGQGKSPGIYTRIFEFCDWIYNLGDQESIIYDNPDCDFAPSPAEDSNDASQSFPSPSTESPSLSGDGEIGPSTEPPESRDDQQSGSDLQASDENRENVESEVQADQTWSDGNTSTDVPETNGDQTDYSVTYEVAGRRLLFL